MTNEELEKLTAKVDAIYAAARAAHRLEYEQHLADVDRKYLRQQWWQVWRPTRKQADHLTGGKPA